MNRRKKRNPKRGGRLTLTVLLGLVVIVSLCLSGWYVYHQTAADLMSKEKDLKVALAKVDILQHRIAELHRNAAKNLEKKTVKRKVMAEKVPASRPLPTPPTPQALPVPQPQLTQTGDKKWLIIEFRRCLGPA